MFFLWHQSLFICTYLLNIDCIVLYYTLVLVFTDPISCACCRASAEEAIQKMQGKMIGQQVVRISWGRTLAARQVILLLEMIPCLIILYLFKGFLAVASCICDTL